MVNYLIAAQCTREHPDVFIKSKLPAMRARQVEAVVYCRELLQERTGGAMTTAQLERLIGNMKRRVKEDTVKQTGNLPVNLSPWQIIIRDIMGLENPTLDQVPGAIVAGIIQRPARAAEDQDEEGLLTPPVTTQYHWPQHRCGDPPQADYAYS